MAHTLIIRYNRLGDALISIPIIYNLAYNYKEDTFTVISNGKLSLFFSLMPSNVTFIPMVSKGRMPLLRGILYTIRRKIFFKRVLNLCNRVDKIAIFQNESFERKIIKELIKSKKEYVTLDTEYFDSDERLENKCIDDLNIMDLYRESLNKINYLSKDVDFPYYRLKDVDITDLCAKLKIDKTKKVLAIAPFSFQESKVYPLLRMEKIIAYWQLYSESHQLLILGGGSKEKMYAEELERKYPHVISLIDKLSFSDEVLIIASSDLVLTMDSANLHLATLVGTPVISIWGATVPQCGYYPEKESQDMAIVKSISCQPCSLWGEKKCTLEPQYQCFDIDPQVVLEKMEKVTQKN